MTCKHEGFEVAAAVRFFEDTGGRMAEFKLRCKECGAQMQFLGLQPGLDMQGASVDLEGTELRVAVAPVGEHPSPLQRMAFGVSRFDG